MELAKITQLFSSSVSTLLPLKLVARLIVIYLIWIKRMWYIPLPFLPFSDGLDGLRNLPELFVLLDVLLWVCLIAILLGVRFQSFCILLSFLIFFQIFGSKLAYSTSFLFSGCMLFLIGIFQSGLEWAFRVQISLLYLGAGLNKLLNLDWRSGQYFKNFLLNVYSNPLTKNLSKLVDIDYLSLSLSYFTIAVEISLGIWVFSGKRSLLLVYSILIFHFGILVFTLGDLSYTYFYLMSVSSYLLLPWNQQIFPNNHTINGAERLKTDSIFDKDKFFEEWFLFFFKTVKSRITLVGFMGLIFQKKLFLTILFVIVYLSRHRIKILELLHGY